MFKYAKNNSISLACLINVFKSFTKIPIFIYALLLKTAAVIKTAVSKSKANPTTFCPVSNVFNNLHNNNNDKKLQKN